MEMLIIGSLGIALLIGIVILILNLDAHGHGGGHGTHGHEQHDPLETILNGLDPEKVTEKVIVPHRKIRNSWKIEDPQIKDYDKFRKHISGYVQHHWKNWYKGQIGEEEAFGHARQVLDAVFEKEGGFQHAYKLAKEGKLDDVISAISNQFEAQSHNSYIAHQLSIVPPDDLDAQTDLVKKVFEKYKHLTPEGTKFKKPEYYARNHGKMIQAYRGLMDQFLNQYAEKKEQGHGDGHDAHGGGHH
ncbi:hypothetical protein HZA96_01550 [Candidatus Woesearchaeota archaeon]|nr:hypothetical protein [Candidatus Woesearchaeota archaeon]